MPEKTVGELKAERRALDRQIAEAEGREPPPLTLREIRQMTPEEARAEWERIRPTLAAAPLDGDRISRESAQASLRRGYEQSDPQAIREARQQGRGARRGLEGSDHGGE